MCCIIKPFKEFEVKAYCKNGKIKYIYILSIINNKYL